MRTNNNQVTHVFTCSRCGKQGTFSGKARAESRQLLNTAGWWSKRVSGRSKDRGDEAGLEDLCPDCVKWVEGLQEQQRPLTPEEIKRGLEIAEEFHLLKKDEPETPSDAQ